ncbi:MAG: hypothetical protein LBQ86_06760 [Holophagales bacterium]|jgi:hypothetical protein|nr:hypothetical protein [Holophagales bacterium]
MNRLLDEGNLQFDFSAFNTADRFDDKRINPSGMKAVDFVAETDDYLYFIEVKDYQNPKATEERRRTDYKMLIAAGTQKKAIFNIEVGEKIKDSLLRKYSLGEKIIKDVVYLLFINLDKLGAFERGLLKSKIIGHVPTGLNDNRFCEFTEISFDLVSAEQLKSYGITCTAKQ